jgi:GNAT superfamily N-acetyltransferase
MDRSRLEAAAMTNLDTEHHRSALHRDTYRWVPIRRLGEQHRKLICEHLIALDTDDRSRRFGHLATDERIGHYVDSLDFDTDSIFGVFDRGLRLASLVHLAFDRPGSEAVGTAEFGISVLPRMRGRGVGALLFDHAMTLARNRAVNTLLIHLARDNAPMLAIVKRAGASVTFAGSDAMASLALPTDTLGSQLQEMFDHQAGELDYRLKSQAFHFRPAV